MDDAQDREYRLLFEQTPVPFQSLDVEGRILYVNQAWSNVLGYSLEEVVGKWFGDFLVPEQQDLFRQRFPQFKAVGYVENIDFNVVTKSGQIKSVLFEGNIVHDEQGRFLHTHCVFMDVTEKKQAEQQRNEQMVELTKMNKLIVDRELKMVQLKERIRELEKKQFES